MDRPADSMGDPSDAALVQNSLEDPTAFGLIFTRHIEAISRYISRNSAPAFVEDLTAETFLIAFDKRSRFDVSRESCLPWLFGIASNVLRHHYRSQHRQRRLRRKSESVFVTEYISTDGDPSQAETRMEAARLEKLLARALDQINEDSREALLLFAQAGLSYPEIAEALEVPIGTINRGYHGHESNCGNYCRPWGQILKQTPRLGGQTQMDEIEILRQSMESVPMPSTELADRVRERLAEAMYREVAASVSAPNTRSKKSTDRLWSVAASIVVIVSLAFAVLGGQTTLNHSAPNWRVSGYIAQPAWSQAQIGPPGGYLTCPTSTICYVVRIGEHESLLQVSRDGGHTWSTVTLPSGITLTTGLSCTGEETCTGAAVSEGASPGENVLLFTTDGGLHWGIRSTSVGTGTLYELNCVTDQDCFALAATDPSNPTASSFLSTTDGGGSWKAESLPSRAVVTNLTCSSSACLISGNDRSPSGVGTGFLQVTTDAGASWSTASLPDGTANVSEVVCPSPTQCYAILPMPLLPYRAAHCSLRTRPGHLNAAPPATP